MCLYVYISVFIRIINVALKVYIRRKLGMSRSLSWRIYAIFFSSVFSTFFGSHADLLQCPQISFSSEFEYSITQPRRQKNIIKIKFDLKCSFFCKQFSWNWSDFEKQSFCANFKTGFVISLLFLLIFMKKKFSLDKIVAKLLRSTIWKEKMFLAWK